MPSLGTSQVRNSGRRFALLGAAGFVAPRHVAAIRDTGSELLAVCDPNPAIEIVSEFQDAQRFADAGRFLEYLRQLRSEGRPVDFVSVCTPSHLHDHHIRLALSVGSHVVCEKPVTLTTSALDELMRQQSESELRVYTVLQLRQHAAIVELKHELEHSPAETFHEVQVAYVTPRSNGYRRSWKGSAAHSGGIAINLGVHVFDLLLWLFGDVVESTVRINTATRLAGELRLQKACVRWSFSLEESDLPFDVRNGVRPTHRIFTVDNRTVDLATGLHQLHTETYRQILNGNGIDLHEARRSLKLAENIQAFEAQGDWSPALPSNAVVQ